MPKHIRGKSQALKERRGLKKLRSLGIIKRTDLRRAPSPAQKRTLKKYADVISGKAKVLRPKNPNSYRDIFKVAGRVVIVPRRKGETVKVDKAGRIKRTRKIGKQPATSGTFIKAKKIKPPKAGGKERTVYALPVGSGDGVKWFRFRTYQDLQAFLSEFSKPYKNPDQYILVETLKPGERTTPHGGTAKRDHKLDDRLEEKLRTRRHERQRDEAMNIIGEDLL